MWFYREFKSNWKNEEQVEENYIGKNFKFYIPKNTLNIFIFLKEELLSFNKSGVLTTNMTNKMS
jgi:hypothetical protein